MHHEDNGRSTKVIVQHIKIANEMTERFNYQTNTKYTIKHLHSCKLIGVEPRRGSGSYIKTPTASLSFSTRDSPRRVPQLHPSYLNASGQAHLNSRSRLQPAGGSAPHLRVVYSKGLWRGKESPFIF